MTNAWTAPLAKQWARLGAPLRPDADDLARLHRAVQPAIDRASARPGLLLGVTAGLTKLCPQMMALDLSATMIRTFYESGSPSCSAVQGDWLAMPLPAKHFAFSVCDLGLTLLSWPDGYRTLFAELNRVLQDGALVGFRCAVAPSRRETPDAVMADAFAGTIASFHGFKFRLAQALLPADGNPSIPVARVHAMFNQLAADRDALGLVAGWDRGTIDTIDAYRDSDAIYSFPTLTQIEHLAERAGWKIVFQEHGAYEMAERFPVLAFARA